MAAIFETFLKLLCGIKYDYTSDDLRKLKNKEFYKIWKDLREDRQLRLFTMPFPNTILWNASKHNGIFKKVAKKVVEFKSNEGSKTLPYRDFISLVRITLSKLSIFIDFKRRHTKILFSFLYLIDIDSFILRLKEGIINNLDHPRTIVKSVRIENNSTPPAY